MRKYQVILSRTPDRRYHAEVIGLGCEAEAPTRAEALARVREQAAEYAFDAGRDSGAAGVELQEPPASPFTLDDLRRHRDDILRLAAKNGARNVRVFGSVVRGEAVPESDIDFLVDEGPQRTPWFPGGVIADLEELLGRKVDVVVATDIKPLLRPYILAEAVPLTALPEEPLPPMAKTNRVYIEHILDNLRRIERIAAGGKDAFLADEVAQPAVLYLLQTMAESTKRLESDLKRSRPEVDWKRVAAFRNVLVHEYLGVDLEKVWAVIVDDLPVLKGAVEEVAQEER